MMKLARVLAEFTTYVAMIAINGACAVSAAVFGKWLFDNYKTEKVETEEVATEGKDA